MLTDRLCLSSEDSFNEEDYFSIEEYDSDSETSEQNILDKCNNADENHKCMVIFKVGESQEEIKIHSCFLAAKSPVMEKMFFGSLKENTDIKIEDTEPDTFRSFVTFLYTKSEKIITDKNVDGLLYLSSKYCTLSLFGLCESFLAFKLDVTNIAAVINTSVLFSCYFLQAKIFEFIIKHQNEIFPSQHLNDCTKESFEFLLKSSYLAVPEDDIVSALELWVDNQLIKNELTQNGLNLRQVMEPFLKYIRLQLLSKQKCKLLLSNNNYPDEAVQDIKLFLKRQTSLYIPKYFSTFSRYNIFEALQYETKWVGDETRGFNFWTNEHTDLHIQAVIVNNNSNEKYRLNLGHEFSIKPIVKSTYDFPNLKTGYFICFLPDPGFLVQMKGTITIENKLANKTHVSDLLACVKFNPTLKSYQMFRKDFINIEDNQQQSTPSPFNFGTKKAKSVGSTGVKQCLLLGFSYTLSKKT